MKSYLTALRRISSFGPNWTKLVPALPVRSVRVKFCSSGWVTGATHLGRTTTCNIRTVQKYKIRISTHKYHIWPGGTVWPRFLCRIRILSGLLAISSNRSKLALRVCAVVSNPIRQPTRSHSRNHHQILVQWTQLVPWAPPASDTEMNVQWLVN